jgi:hypothetical protein
MNFADAVDHRQKTDGNTDLQITSGKRNFNFIYIQNNKECEEPNSCSSDFNFLIFQMDDDVTLPRTRYIPD